MTADPHSPNLLELARQDIDRLDDQILSLLAQRFAVTEKVRQAKAGDKDAWPLPIRPARESAILRRLLAKAKGTPLTPDLVVRLWRAIICQSSLNQAPISIHVSRHLNGNTAHRLRLRDHFGAMPVEEYRDEAQALLQINAQPSDLCVVETEQPWAEAFVAGKAGAARVIAALPVLKEEGIPKLLVIGQAPLSDSGDDETLVISSGKLPRDFAPEPAWQAKSGALRLSALPGFLPEHESPLVGLSRSNAALGLVLAGHYSRAFGF
ncbi:MAG: chorismate mutase [Alphaproteobacteria bacterium]|nr:chorismate mutase [Alphaproteobacteria bacterium]